MLATLDSVDNLALLLEDQGKLADAEPMYRRSLEARERTLGAGHADTLASANNSAWLLRAMDAEQLAKVLALSKETDKDVPFDDDEITRALVLSMATDEDVPFDDDELTRALALSMETDKDVPFDDDELTRALALSMEVEGID